MSEHPQNPYDPAPRPVYGVPGQVWGPPPDHPQATTVLVLGILSFAVCQVVAPFAWAMGSRVRREITASGGTLGGHQIATFGWVLGIVGSCILILGLLFALLYVVIAVVAVSTSA